MASVNIYLANCHIKKKNFIKAQDLLDKELSDAPMNTNALVAQVFLYSDWSESLTSNPEGAVKYLIRGERRDHYFFVVGRGRLCIVGLFDE